MQSNEDFVSRMPNATMISINKFGEKVVEVITFPNDDTVYYEEFEKSTLHVNHPVGKIFPKSVVEMLNIPKVRYLDSSCTKRFSAFTI